VVAAVPSMDVVEDLVTLSWLDAALEHSCSAALIELVVDDGEGLAAPLNHPGLRFVCWEDLLFEEGEVWRCPVFSELGDGNEGLFRVEWDADVHFPRW